MKKSLSHLPQHKRAELKRITAVIRDYEDVYAVILFGSYARGTWVEDRYKEGHITYEYMSDYDILVVPVNTGGPRFNHLEEKLGKQAAGADPAFLNIIPNHTPEEKRLFKLLKKAYIDARYKKEYKITKKELEYLGDKVKNLQKLTQKMCKTKIESFTSNNSLHGMQTAHR